MVDNIKVDTAVTATVNVTLEPGAVETVVNITSEGALLNLESGTPGQTITERQIRDLPLNNRSVLDLVLTAGNVSGVAGTEDPELGADIPAPASTSTSTAGAPAARRFWPTARTTPAPGWGAPSSPSRPIRSRNSRSRPRTSRRSSARPVAASSI